MPAIDINPWFMVFGGGHPVNWARNGVQPPAPGLRLAADFVNTLLGMRKKQLFAKSLRPTGLITSTSEIKTWRFAHHTGPAAKAVIAHFVVLPSDAPTNGTTTRCWWAADKGAINGAADPTTDKPSVFVADASTATLVPNDYREAWQVIPVDADQDYRFVLHLENGMRVMSSTVYEVSRTSFNPIIDTEFVDSTKYAQGLPIHDAPATDIFAGAASCWERNQSGIFPFSVGGTTAITRLTNTEANLLDQTVTARSASSPGWPAYPLNRHSFDSNNVPGVFYCYAAVDGGTGLVQLVSSKGTVVTIPVNAAERWWAMAFDTTNFDGTVDNEKLDVLITGPGGGNTLSVWAAGAFLKV